MNESGRRFEAFEGTHNPEILENNPEQHQEVYQCQAEIQLDEIQKKKGILPSIINTSMSCDGCPFEERSFMTGGRSGYVNARKEVVRVLKTECGRWKERADSGASIGEMPNQALPKF